MAVCHLVFGNITAKTAVLTSDFSSKEMNSAETYTFAGVDKNYLIVTALNDIYVAFTNNGTAPNTAAQPRMRINSGQFFAFSISNGTKISVVNA